MNINEWFKNNCPYNEGVALYEALPKHNKFLLKKFKLKQTDANLVKLRYELQKYLAPTIGNSSKEIQVVTESVVEDKQSADSSESKYYRKVLLKDLPIELHEPYRRQKDDFYKATSLHIQLGNLKPTEQSKALQLCLEIDRLFDSIEKTWELIDFYTENGYVPKIKTDDFTSLSETELLLKRTSRRSSLTRANARLKKLQNQLQNSLSKANTIKLQRKVADKEAHIIKLQLDIDLLEKLINTKTNT